MQILRTPFTIENGTLPKLKTTTAYRSARYINGEVDTGERLPGIKQVTQSAFYQITNGQMSGLHITIFPDVEVQGFLTQIEGDFVLINFAS